MPQMVHNLVDGSYHTDFEIDEREYFAIGRLCVQWAYLEHGIYAITHGLAKAAGIDVPPDALRTSFDRRLKAFRLTVEETTKSPHKEKLLRLHSKIANLEQDRHKVIHGMWEMDPKNPDRLLSSSFRKGFEFEKAYDMEKIYNLGSRIGAVSFELEYPDGAQGFMAQYSNDDGDVSFFHISRRMLREMKARQSPGTPDPGSPKPPKGKRPRPSSGE